MRQRQPLSRRQIGPRFLPSGIEAHQLAQPDDMLRVILDRLADPFNPSRDGSRVVIGIACRWTDATRAFVEAAAVAGGLNV